MARPACRGPRGGGRHLRLAATPLAGLELAEANGEVETTTPKPLLPCPYNLSGFLPSTPSDVSWHFARYSVAFSRVALCIAADLFWSAPTVDSKEAVRRIGTERCQSRMGAEPRRAIGTEDGIRLAHIDVDVRVVVRWRHPDALELLHPDADFRDAAVVPEHRIAAAGHRSYKCWGLDTPPVRRLGQGSELPREPPQRTKTACSSAA
jgi:hypothetical protein